MHEVNFPSSAHRTSAGPASADPAGVSPGHLASQKMQNLQTAKDADDRDAVDGHGHQGERLGNLIFWKMRTG